MLVGIIYLLIRRAFVRPVALGAKLSLESIVIALFIATLMITFLLTFRLEEGTMAARVNWWVHALVILGVHGADSRRRSTFTSCCRRSRCS